MQLFKEIIGKRFRATLNFQNKFKVAPKNFLNFASFACSLQLDNKKWGSPSSLFSYKHLKSKLKVSLTGNTVTMVPCFIIRERDYDLLTNDWAFV